MYEGVDQTYEKSVASGEVLDATPTEHRHTGVMEDVQKGDLAVVLSQHEEDCV